MFSCNKHNRLVSYLENTKKKLITSPQSDSAGEPTIASRYTQWYSDVLLRRVSAGHICFSNTLRSFVSLSAEGAIPFNAEEFTDPTELRSLAELLGRSSDLFQHFDVLCTCVGPYGVKLLNETLMWHIQSQVTELRMLVLLNKEILITLRTNLDKPDIMKELFKRLQNVDSVLQRMTIIGGNSSYIFFSSSLLLFAGVILCFRELIQDALSTQLEERIPFLTSSNKHFHCHAGSPHESSLVAELACASGYSSKVDPALLAT